MDEHIITHREFARRLGVSVATLDRREAEAVAEKNKTFPRRRALGTGKNGRIGYLESEVTTYLRELPTVPVKRTLDGHAARLRNANKDE